MRARTAWPSTAKAARCVAGASLADSGGRRAQVGRRCRKGRVAVRAGAGVCAAPNHAVCGGVAAVEAGREAVAWRRARPCCTRSAPWCPETCPPSVNTAPFLYPRRCPFVWRCQRPTTRPQARYGAARRGQGVAAAAATQLGLLRARQGAHALAAPQRRAPHARTLSSRAGHRGSTPQRYRGKVLIKGRSLVKGVGQGFGAVDGPTINILVEGQGPLEPVPNSTHAAGLCVWAEKGRGCAPRNRT